MKTLYIDCGMGAAGDMLTGALLELFDTPDEIVDELNGLGIPGVTFLRESASKCGITGTHMRVLVDGAEEACDHHHPHEHHHGSMGDISHILSHAKLPPQVRESVLAVYDLIAQAESAVHGVPMEQIHFHEVGTMDAVADITAVCCLLDKLGADQIIASPVHVGAGQVHCAHGILPVPAPATAQILKDVPIYGGEIQGELCTPTGAALLKHFVARFAPMPPMCISAIGYGMGKKDFPRANCVRVFLGETQEDTGTVVELTCNLDDMTGEEIGFATEALLACGALDVFTSPVFMKKNRPGTMLTVLCKPDQKDTLVRQIFRHTTTLGIREAEKKRYTLTRETQTVSTDFGPVRQKTASGYGVQRSKPEYEDLARLAREHGLSLREIANATEKE